MPLKITTILRRLGACKEALIWAKPYGTDYARAWAECPRGDWLLWMVGQPSGPPSSEGRKRLVLAACGCARLALAHTESSEVLTCIEEAEGWARGERTLKELNQARMAAFAASATYAATSAAYVAYAAAAYAAAAASAGAAEAAAGAAAYAAGAASEAASYAKSRVLAQCAGIVREYYPEPPVIEG